MTTAVCLENHFTSHGLCDENRERCVEVRVQPLLEAVGNKSAEGVRPFDVQKLMKSLN